MTLLAIDLGSHMGFARRRPSGAIESGVKHFVRGVRDGQRYHAFRAWLHVEKMLCDTRREPIRLIRYEKVNGARWRSAQAAAVVLGMRAHLEAWAEHHGIEYEGFSTFDLKRSATGKANADKPAMVAAMQAKGFKPVSHDEADALALLFVDKGGENGQRAA